MRVRGTKVTQVVFGGPDVYASFPQIYRTDRETVVVYQVQDLAGLRTIKEHPHYQKLARPGWAVSRDQGSSWTVVDSPPAVGWVLDATNPAVPLADGGSAVLCFDKSRPKYSFIQHGVLYGYRQYLSLDVKGVERYSFDEFGPFDNFFPFEIIRTEDGLVAAGYASVPGKKQTTVLFLKSTDEARTWKYLSCVDNPHPFGFSEPALLAGPGNHLQVFLRTDLCYLPKEQWPADGGAGEEVYGYYLYHAESFDGGATWSEAQRLPIWGHPPCVKRLASGNVLMVFGVRRKPHGIQAVLSRDNGKTWDLSTLKVVHVFDPGSYDMGYPVITQYPDGSILCAFYGFTSTDTQSKSPHGIFASIFDEEWLTKP